MSMNIRTLLGIGPEVELLTGTDFDAGPILHVCYDFSNLESTAIKRWTSDLLGSLWDSDATNRWSSRIEFNPEANPC